MSRAVHEDRVGRDSRDVTGETVAFDPFDGRRYFLALDADRDPTAIRERVRNKPTVRDGSVFD